MELKIEKPYRVLFGDTHCVNIMLVGIGGTGSHLALSLGRLAYHARDKGMQVKLVFVDPDTFEPANCGRQLATPAEIGYPKASCLAWRITAAFGLEVTAIPERFEAKMAHEWLPPFMPGGRGIPLNLIIGAVDNHLARREITKALAEAGGRLWAIDNGNAHSNGQILVGNLVKLEEIRFTDMGLCSGLPSPYVQEPALLEPEEEGGAPLSCAELTLREEQGLMINTAVAAIAAQYCYQIVIRRELYAFATWLNLDPPVVTSKLVTKENIERIGRTTIA
ncbi:MAG: ThiF family adenylyltransferase [Chloroflexi bacterium]|nr:ThiF family adenylyltransferase [Chloroflexota bacterium]